jgi:hypothetical protein
MNACLLTFLLFLFGETASIGSTRYVRMNDMYITRLFMRLIYVNVMYITQMYMRWD